LTQTKIQQVICSRLKICGVKLELDTDHCFYLLDGQIIDNCTASILKEWIIREQGSNGYFGRNTDITQW